MYSAIAIPMEAVADHIPLKQGLRLEILFTSVKSSFVADHIKGTERSVGPRQRSLLNRHRSKGR